MIRPIPALTTAMIVCAIARTTLAQGTPSPIQSDARPFGMQPVAPVMLAGSDARSATFQANTLARLRQLAGRNLSQWTPANNALIGLQKIDPKWLRMLTGVDLRTYFVSESDATVKSLGFNATGVPQLIFPDVATSTPDSDLAGGSGTRTNANPLKPGDFVNLGNYPNDTDLYFFLNVDDQTYASTNENSDGALHTVAYTLPGSPYLLMGFETGLDGGDGDYNDALFAFDIGAANVNYLSSPEPGAWWSLGALLGIVALVRRRAQGRSSR